MTPNTWKGVDLDGTLAFYDEWRGALHIGPPIPAMVERVKAWLAEGWEVRVFTARMSEPDPHMRKIIGAVITAWAEEYIGAPLVATCVKDFTMSELWDDRAVGVEFNTGAVRGGERPPALILNRAVDA